MLGAIGHVSLARRAEHGFSLIELLVAMLLGMVVITALITIIIATLHQSTRTFSRVDATARSRTMLEQVANELHSACVGDQVTPIQAGATGNTLIFESLYGNTSATQFANAASPTPVEHQIDFSSAANTVTDTIYPATGNANGTWTFSTTPQPGSPRVLLTNVTQVVGTPMFQYYAYQSPRNALGNPYTDAAGNAYMMLLDGTSSVPGTSPAVIPTASPLTATTASPMSAANADLAAEVYITMNVGPYKGTGVNTTIADARATVTDSVVFRVTPPANHVGAGATFAPCQ